MPIYLCCSLCGYPLESQKWDNWRQVHAMYEAFSTTMPSLRRDPAWSTCVYGHVSSAPMPELHAVAYNLARIWPILRFNLDFLSLNHWLRKYGLSIKLNKVRVPFPWSTFAKAIYLCSSLCDYPVAERGQMKAGAMPCVISSDTRDWTRHYLCWVCVFEDREDDPERMEVQRD